MLKYINLHTFPPLFWSLENLAMNYIPTVNHIHLAYRKIHLFSMLLYFDKKDYL